MSGKDPVVPSLGPTWTPGWSSGNSPSYGASPELVGGWTTLRGGASSGSRVPVVESFGVGVNGMIAGVDRTGACSNGITAGTLSIGAGSRGITAGIDRLGAGSGGIMAGIDSSGAGCKGAAFSSECLTGVMNCPIVSAIKF